MGQRAEQAQQLFKQGYNCSQAVLCAFAEDVGMEEQTAFLLSSSFGAGMGQLREVCGAVSAMFMLVGMRYGYSDPSDQAGKKAHYQRIQRLAEAYKKENESIICRELLGLDRQKDDPSPAERTEQYYKKRPCVELVRSAAEIMERELEEEEPK